MDSILDTQEERCSIWHQVLEKFASIMIHNIKCTYMFIYKLYILFVSKFYLSIHNIPENKTGMLNTKIISQRL